MPSAEIWLPDIVLYNRCDFLEASAHDQNDSSPGTSPQGGAGLGHGSVVRWLGHWTRDLMVMSSIPGSRG